MHSGLSLSCGPPLSVHTSGLMLLARDGGLWPVEKESIVSRRADAKAFAPLTNAELTKQLSAELPGFKTFQTQHYLIHYNTSPAYAKWVGSLFEGDDKSKSTSGSKPCTYAHTSPSGCGRSCPSTNACGSITSPLTVISPVPRAW